MIVDSLMNVLSDGTACFSILPYCEEYGEGLEEMKNEPWYNEIKNCKVKRIVTIGGGMSKVETFIELDGADEIIVHKSSTEDIVIKQLKEMYPNGLPDGLVVDMSRPLGKTSKELFLTYLAAKGYTEESHKALDGLKQYQLHCGYCNFYNIPHIED